MTLDVPAELRPWIGWESEPMPAPGPIEWSDVRRFMNATGDTNPRWGDADPVTNPNRTGTLVPPTLLLDAFRAPVGADTYDGDSGTCTYMPNMFGPTERIPAPGFTRNMNAGSRVQWLRPLRVGDWLTVQYKLTDIVIKETRQGPALFLTEERRYTDQQGELVALMQLTSFRLALPAAGGEAT